jgi:phosphoribosyl-AMP cyclohydrolase
VESAPTNPSPFALQPSTDLKWDEHELITAVVQDAQTTQVLMVAWMNAEALRLTLATGETYFWSRSRGELWHKGATSGNTLVQVEPAGPACHTGKVSCFFRRLDEPRSE